MVQQSAAVLGNCKFQSLGRFRSNRQPFSTQRSAACVALVSKETLEGFRPLRRGLRQALGRGELTVCHKGQSEASSPRLNKSRYTGKASERRGYPLQGGKAPYSVPDAIRKQFRGNHRLQAVGSESPRRSGPDKQRLGGVGKSSGRKGWASAFKGLTKLEEREVALLEQEASAESRTQGGKDSRGLSDWVVQLLSGRERSEKWDQAKHASDADATSEKDGPTRLPSRFASLLKSFQAKGSHVDSQGGQAGASGGPEKEKDSEDEEPAPTAFSSWTSLDEPWASIVLLNLLAALYGSNAVAAKFVEEAVVVPPASLACAVKFSFAALAFSPVLWNVLTSEKSKDKKTVLAGIELGMWLMAGIVSQTVGMKSGSSSISLLFTFTIILVPLLEVSTGRRSISQFTWLASLAALTGMGLLKDHGGLTLDLVAPPVEDLWGLFSSAMFAIQIFRAEMLCQKFDPLRLVATLLGVLAVLSIGWEGWSLLHAGNGIEPLERQLRGLPVWPLMYGGLIAGGLGGLLELTGLQNVHASTATLIYTTIPIWGAFFSFLVRGESIGEPATLVGGSLMFGCSMVAGFLQPKKVQEPPPEAETKKKEKQAALKEEKREEVQQNVIMAAVRDLVRGRSGDVAEQLEERKGRKVLGLRPHEEAVALKRQVARSKESEGESKGVMGRAMGALAAFRKEEPEPEPEPEKETLMEMAIDALTAPFHKEEEVVPLAEEKIERSNSFGKAAARLGEAIMTSGENFFEGAGEEKENAKKVDESGVETDDEGEEPSVNSDTLPAAYLTTQLKMPFYATQAQGMMAGASGVGATAGAGASGAAAGSAAAGGAAASTAAGGAGAVATGAAATGGAAAGTAAAGAGAAAGGSTAASAGAALTAAAAPASTSALAGAAASTGAAATGAAATGATAAATGAAATTGAVGAAASGVASSVSAAATGAAATGAAATGAAVTGAAATVGGAVTGGAVTGAATGAAVGGAAATGAAALTGAATGAAGTGVAAAGAGAAVAGSTAAGALTGAAASAGGALTTAATSAATAATGAAVTGSATTAAAAGAAGAFVGAAAGTAATGATATTVATTGAAAAAAGAIGTAAAVAGGGAISGATGGAAAVGSAAVGAACGVVPSAATGAATTAAAGGSAAAAGGAAAGGLLSISVVANEAVNVIVGGIGSPSGAGAVITGVAKAAGKTIVQAASPVTEAGASLLADVAGLAADTPLAAFVKEVAATTQAAAGFVTGAGAEAGVALESAAQAGSAAANAAVTSVEAIEALAASQITEAATAVAQSAAVAQSTSEVTSAAGMLSSIIENAAAAEAASGAASELVVGADPLAQGLTAAVQSAGSVLEKAVEMSVPVSGQAVGASEPLVNNVPAAVQAVVAAIEKAAETALPVASESAAGSAASAAGDPLASAIASGAADIGAATSEAWASAAQAVGSAIEGALPASQGAEVAASAASGSSVVDPLASEMVSKGAEFAAAVTHAAGPAVQAAVHAATTAAAVAGASGAVTAVAKGASNILANAGDQFTWVDSSQSGLGDAVPAEGHRAAATVLGMMGPLDMHALEQLYHVGPPLIGGGLALCWLLQATVSRQRSPGKVSR